MSIHFLTGDRRGDVVAAEDLILTRQTVFGLVYIPGVVRRLHIHDFFEIDIVLRGNGRLSFKQQTRVCQAGDICILFPGAHHDFEIGPEDIAISLVVRQSTFASSFFDHLSPEAAGLFLAGTEGGPGCLVFSTGRTEDGSIFEDQIIFPVSLSGCLVCRPEVTDAEKTVDCYELFHIFSSIFI